MGTLADLSSKNIGLVILQNTVTSDADIDPI